MPGTGQLRWNIVWEDSCIEVVQEVLFFQGRSRLWTKVSDLLLFLNNRVGTNTLFLIALHNEIPY